MTTILLRRDTAANWTSINPVLQLGEPGFDEDAKKIKVGDGVTHWTSLAYLDSPDLTAVTNEQVRAEAVEALKANDSTVVHNTTNETVAGVKTFASSPVVPTPSALDNSTKAASTAYVDAAVSVEKTRAIAAEGANATNIAANSSAIAAETARATSAEATAVHQTGNESIAGVKSFSSSPVVPNNSALDNSTKAANTAYVDAAVAVAIAGGLKYRGTFDASVNAFPSSGGSGAAGAIKQGDLWVVSVAGTTPGGAVTPGDLILAKVDSPGVTAANWDQIEHDLTYAPENVANKSTDGTLAANSDTLYPSQKAVKTAIANQAATDAATYASIAATTAAQATANAAVGLSIVFGA